MYWLDTLLLALLALGGALGFWSGFLWQIARTLTFAIALAATVMGNEKATQLCQEQLLRDADPRISQAIAYVLVFLVVYLICFYASKLLHASIRAADLEMVDRLLGALFGAGKMALLLAALCLSAANYPHPATRTLLSKSTLAPAFADGMEHVLILIPEEYKENLCGTLVSLRDMLSKPTTETHQEDKSRTELSQK